MMHIVAYLYLTCYLFIIFPVNLCPASHPNPYLGGEWCCKTDQEKSGASVPIPETCDGGKIGYNSVCCDNDDYSGCPYIPCACEGDCELGYGTGP